MNHSTAINASLHGNNEGNNINNNSSTATIDMMNHSYGIRASSSHGNKHHDNMNNNTALVG